MSDLLTLSHDVNNFELAAITGGISSEDMSVPISKEKEEMIRNHVLDQFYQLVNDQADPQIINNTSNTPKPHLEHLLHSAQTAQQQNFNTASMENDDNEFVMTMEKRPQNFTQQ